MRCRLTTRPKITVTADGEGVVSHAGSRLLADVADRTTLTRELSQVLAGLYKPRPAMILVGCWLTWQSRSPMGPPRSPMSRCWLIRPSCSGWWRRTRRAGGCWTGSTPPRSVQSPQRGLRRGR